MVLLVPEKVTTLRRICYEKNIIVLTNFVSEERLKHVVWVALKRAVMSVSNVRVFSQFKLIFILARTVDQVDDT